MSNGGIRQEHEYLIFILTRVRQSQYNDLRDQV